MLKAKRKGFREDDEEDCRRKERRRREAKNVAAQRSNCMDGREAGNCREEYDPQAIEKKWQARWNADHAFEADADPSKPKYYVLEMLPYPSGTHAHGAHAQLHHRRRGGALPAHAGFPCDSPDGLGRLRTAGGKRGDPAGNSSARVDQHATSLRSSACCTDSDSAMTGGAKFPPASRNITSGTSGSFCACWNAELPTASAAA